MVVAIRAVWNCVRATGPICTVREEESIAPVLTLRARRILLIASGAWLLVTLIALSAGPWSVQALETRLETAAREALNQQGYDWAQVTVEGQVATLVGAAPSDTARDGALETVRVSTWSGGVVAGGVTRVVDRTTDRRLQPGFAFRADASNGRATIVGDAPDDATRDAIERHANNIFASGAETDLTINPGGAMTDDWEDAAKRLLGQLARLDRGSVVLDSEQGAIFGEAANPQIADSVAGALASMPEPFRVAHVVTPAGAEAEINVGDINACRVVLAAAGGADPLRFDQGGQSPSSGSEDAIRRMGTGFAACPEPLRLQFAVRLDDGDESLADARAAIVRTLLVESGVMEEKIDRAPAGDQTQVISLTVTMDEG